MWRSGLPLLQGPVRLLDTRTLCPPFFFSLNIYLVGCTGLKLVGSGSLTREQTRAPCTGTMGSQPLDHEESPLLHFFDYRKQPSFSLHGLP